MLRAETTEAPVWEFVSGLLKDPERLTAGMDRLIGEELAGRADSPELEVRVLSAEAGRVRPPEGRLAGAAGGGPDDPGRAVGEARGLDAAKRLAQDELANLSEHRRRAEALLAFRLEAVPQGLDNLSPEDRAEVYRLLRLEVSPSENGLRVSGAFCASELSCS